jgi:hypothetical protein
VFIPTAAQQLDTKVYNHVANLLHVSVFFGRLQEGVLEVMNVEAAVLRKVITKIHGVIS